MSTVLITPCWPVRTMRAEALFSDKGLNDLADGPAEDCQTLCSTALQTMIPPATHVFCQFFWQSSETNAVATEYSSHQRCLLSQPVEPHHSTNELGLTHQLKHRYWAFQTENVSIYLAQGAAVKPQSMAGVWDFGDADDIKPLEDSSGGSHCTFKAFHGHQLTRVKLVLGAADTTTEFFELQMRKQVTRILTTSFPCCRQTNEGSCSSSTAQEKRLSW